MSEKTSEPHRWQRYVPTGYAPSPWAIRHMRPLRPAAGPAPTAVFDETTQTCHYVDASGRRLDAPDDATRAGTNTTPMVDED
ncbi:MAG: putative ATP-grasp-modified RiPP [Carbonactinosporaceae bacterium]